jgi:hypothetical protein
MKFTAKEWLTMKRKTTVKRWMRFFMWLLATIAVFILSIPLAILLAIGCIVYAILAGFTAILNAIFYHDRVDKTFYELTCKLTAHLHRFIK